MFIFKVRWPHVFCGRISQKYNTTPANKKQYMDPYLTFVSIQIKYRTQQQKNYSDHRDVRFILKERYSLCAVFRPVRIIKRNLLEAGQQLLATHTYIHVWNSEVSVW